LATIDEVLSSATLSGADRSASIIKQLLIDEHHSRSGLLGVDEALQIVSAHSFEQLPTQNLLNSALRDCAAASAAGVVTYSVSEEGCPVLDVLAISRLAITCQAIGMILLDSFVFPPAGEEGWISARQRGLL
jgi:hypothetical protein